MAKPAMRWPAAHLDSTEKRLFDTIDGERTIGDIVRKGSPSSQEVSLFDAARALFERLWWYDQVVFDTSRHSKEGT
jgi:hypothetical protein